MQERIGTTLSGRVVLYDASLNKGTAFTSLEREQLGLDGLLPARVETIEEQLARIADKYERLHDDLERHIFLRSLQDTNEVLFYRYLRDHLIDLLPIVYTPTVGDACAQFSSIYRRPHGLFLSADRSDRIPAQLAAAQDDVSTPYTIDIRAFCSSGRTSPSTTPPSCSIGIVSASSASTTTSRAPRWWRWPRPRLRSPPPVAR